MKKSLSKKFLLLFSIVWFISSCTKVTLSENLEYILGSNEIVRYSLSLTNSYRMTAFLQNITVDGDLDSANIHNVSRSGAEIDFEWIFIEIIPTNSTSPVYYTGGPIAASEYGWQKQLFTDLERGDNDLQFTWSENKSNIILKK